MSQIPDNLHFAKPIDGEILYQPLDHRAPVGYELLAVVYKGQCTTGNWVSNNGYNNGNNEYRSAPIQATAYYEPYGLYVKSKDRALADLHAAVQDRESKIRACEKALEKLAETDKNHAAVLEELRQEARVATENAKENQLQREKAVTRSITMEKDLGKLRAAIGEIEFNKIIGVERIPVGHNTSHA